MRSIRPTCSFIAASRINIALNGTATQSKTLASGEAEFAIDGNSDPEWSHLSCTHTGGGAKPWWRLQLPGVYRVSEIEVTNRNAHEQGLNDVKIAIGNSLVNNGNNIPRCGIIYHIPGKLTQTVQCRGMEGRFINFFKCQKTHLTLCEVKVYGELVPPPPSIGILGMERNVTLVGKRLSWSDALLYCREFHWDLLSISGPEEQQMIDELVANASFPLTSHLWLGLRRYLTAASRINVALSGTATQSSTLGNGEAKRAIDGNSSPDYSHLSCTHTGAEGKPWWRLQLPGVYRVSEIEVTNRNAARQRLNDVNILIGNSLVNNGNNNSRCAIIHDLPDSVTQTVQCRGMEGRFINFFKCQATYMTLCEVKVYGELVPPPPSISILGMDREHHSGGKEAELSDALLYCREFHWDLLSIRDPEEQGDGPSEGVNKLPGVYRVSEIVLTNMQLLPKRLDGVKIVIGNSLENNGTRNPRLELPGVYRVSEIVLTNMQLLPKRLDGVKIVIGNSLENNGTRNPRYDPRSEQSALLQFHKI
ncbi:hypothetical protein CRUP_019654 [Coryphaenoides rupestris]|nr:hypothetical protein CRUP_019654 [Coryphaenoides rupestris]